MNRELKTALWNVVLRYYLFHSGFLSNQHDMNQLFKRVYADLYNEPLDEMPKTFDQMRSDIKNYIFEGLEWNEIYDLTRLYKHIKSKVESLCNL